MTFFAVAWFITGLSAGILLQQRKDFNLLAVKRTVSPLEDDKLLFCHRHHFPFMPFTAASRTKGVKVKNTTVDRFIPHGNFDHLRANSLEQRFSQDPLLSLWQLTQSLCIQGSMPFVCLLFVSLTSYNAVETLASSSSSVTEGSGESDPYGEAHHTRSPKERNSL